MSEMSASPLVSIIIPTHAREGHLCRLLRDLDGQTYPRHKLEVWVVDDASPQDPTEAVRRLGLDLAVKVLRVPHGGPARARNRALERATGDLVLFLNDDVRAAPDLVVSHVNIHQSLGIPVAVMGTFSFTALLREDLFCRVLEDFGFTHTLQLRSGTWYDYHSFWTGNLSIPRAVLEFVRNFDEDFIEPSHDDLDLGYRLEQALSLRVYFTDLARCSHDHLHTPEMWRRRNQMVGRNLLRMHLKHGLNNLDIFKEARQEEAGPESQALDAEGPGGSTGPHSPRFSRSRLERGQWELSQLASTIEQLHQIVETITSRASVGEVEGVVTVEGRTFELPADTEALLATCLERITHHDQLVGVVEAAFELPELAP